MGLKFKALIGLSVLLATGVLFPCIASAETEAPKEQTTNDVFERAFFRHDRNFYENSTPLRQLTGWFGVGSSFSSFPENEIARDAELVNTLYRDVLKQQVGNDPIRTPDLPNPYNSSLLTSPRQNTDLLKVGNELRVDNVILK